MRPSGSRRVAGVLAPNAVALGQLRLADGSAASPALAFDSDRDTGFYWDTSNRMSFSAAGTFRAYLSSSLIYSGVQLQGVVVRADSGLIIAPTTQNFTAATQKVNTNAPLVVLDSNANYTLTSTPQVETVGAISGTMMRLLYQGTGGFSVTFSDRGTVANSALYLGAATRQLSRGDCLTLVYNAALASWIEVGFSNVL